MLAIVLFFSFLSGETMGTELFGHTLFMVGCGLIAKTASQGLKVKNKRSVAGRMVLGAHQALPAWAVLDCVPFSPPLVPAGEDSAYQLSLRFPCGYG
jgi:hypothetical protein